jgi:hypothetical protein
MELGKVRATVREQPGRSSEQPFGHPEISRSFECNAWTYGWEPRGSYALGSSTTGYTG